MQASGGEGRFRGGTLRWVAGLSAVLLFAEPAWAEPAAQTTREVIILMLLVFAVYAAILGIIVGLYYYSGHKAQKHAEASANRAIPNIRAKTVPMPETTASKSTQTMVPEAKMRATPVIPSMAASAANNRLPSVAAAGFR